MKTLSENRLVEGLSEGQLRVFAGTGREIVVPAGDVVIPEGAANVNLYLVEEGVLEVVFPETDNRLSELSLAQLGEGDYAGEYGFLDSKPASATVRAATDTKLFQISHVGLAQLMEAQPDIGRIIYRNLLLHLVGRLRQANDELDLFKPFS